MNESVSVETLSSISPNDAAALARLLGQLSMAATFDGGRLHAIIDHEATELLVARVGDEATFVSFPLPTGLRGHVEDVVVDESMREALRGSLLGSRARVVGAWLCHRGQCRLLAFGFDQLGLHKISATCDPEKRASVPVLTKKGKHQEEFIATTSVRGQWRDRLRQTHGRNVQDLDGLRRRPGLARGCIEGCWFLVVEVERSQAVLPGHRCHGLDNWAEPDEEVLDFINETEKSMETYLYGRKINEMMIGRETDLSVAAQSPKTEEFARLSQRPKDRLLELTP